MGHKIYIETYGCQMNVVDSETVMAIMTSAGAERAASIDDADVILINTCSIRDNAEQRIWHRLDELGAIKRRRKQAARAGGGGQNQAKAGEGKQLIIGLIGCMAKRLADDILHRQPCVDLVVGPDAYRSLPELVGGAETGAKGINVELSKEETYAEISPVRLDSNGVSAFVSIMRGCNNFCSYCVVPYTRGRERSRDPETILREVRELFEGGYREVTLLGQNVNSYSWEDGAVKLPPCAIPHRSATDLLFPVGELTLPDGRLRFPELLRRVASISPLLRVRFATSHPKDLSDELLETMTAHSNICRAIHLPAQSGSDRMLGKMNRRYTREWYLGRIAAIRKAMPDCAISTDLIAGFCGEMSEDHEATKSLMREVGYEFAFMFKYSERADTAAARTMPDDVPDDVKTARLNEIIALQNELSLSSNRHDVGREFEILVEGTSKRSTDKVFGRTSQNKVVVIDRAKKSTATPNDLATSTSPSTATSNGNQPAASQISATLNGNQSATHQIGNYVRVHIISCSSATLQGEEI